MAEEVERRLAAILSADAVGYSRLISEDEDATVHTITVYREQIAILVEEHQGRVVDFTGDNLLAEFRTARDAVICAIEVQRVLRARNASLSADHRMDFRMGIHMGDVRVEGGRIYGDGVNIAARLEALADAGGICISSTVHDQVRHRISVDFEDLGEKSVKNIPDPVRVYRALLFAAERAEAPAAGVAALLIWGTGGEFGSTARAPGPIRSIAVLPLDNLSGEAEQEFFVDGLTEELTATLARIRALRVISRTSAMQYKGVHKPLREIARELDVDGVIEGSVLRAGTQVRITAQLIRADADEHLWAESYTRELTDILALQAEVATAIVEAVKLELTAAEQVQLASLPQVDADAHEAYLKGRFFLSKGTREGRESAVQWFQTSVEQDPTFALGYAGLADAYSCDRCPGLSEETMLRAESAARRALELDETLAEARTALGVVRALHETGVPRRVPSHRPHRVCGGALRRRLCRVRPRAAPFGTRSGGARRARLLLHASGSAGRRPRSPVPARSGRAARHRDPGSGAHPCGPRRGGRGVCLARARVRRAGEPAPRRPERRALREPPRRPTLRGPPAPHRRAEGRRQALTAVPARRAASD